jgi:hypothetical protein
MSTTIATYKITPVYLPIVCTKGDDLPFAAQAVEEAPDGTQTPFDFTGATAVFEVTTGQTDTVLYSNSSITMDDEGNISFTVPRAVTATWEAIEHNYTLKIIPASGLKRTFFNGTLEIIKP